jgi:hypothetical protein
MMGIVLVNDARERRKRRIAIRDDELRILGRRLHRGREAGMESVQIMLVSEGRVGSKAFTDAVFR